MLLELTVVAGVRLGAGGERVWELSVAWPAGSSEANCSGASLEAALAPHWPGCAFTVQGQPLAKFYAGQPPLIDGAVVVAGPRAGPSDPPGLSGADTGSGAVLAVTAGPGAGALFALQRGEYSIGRGRCRIHIDDPALSRHHGTVVVGREGVMLSTAKGSMGFTVVDAGHSPAPGGRVHGRMMLVEGMAIGCGNSVLELRFPASGEGVLEAGRLLDAAALEPLVVAQAAGAGGSRWALVLAGLLPLVLGVVLALTMGSWMFLAFSAVGAITMVGPLMGGSARRKAFRRAVTTAAAADARRQSAAFPDAATLVLASHSPVPASAHTPAAAKGIALRLGSCPGWARLAVSPDDPGFAPPLVSRLPAGVALTPLPLTIGGAAGAVEALMRFVLLQLDAAAVPVVVLGPAEQLPLAARFMPHTSLSATASGALQLVRKVVAGQPPDNCRCVLLCIRDPVPLWVQDFAALRVLHFAGPQPGLVQVMVRGNHLTATAPGLEFVPDGVPASVFDACARARSRQTAAARQEAAHPGSGPGPRHEPLGSSTVPGLELGTPEAVMHQWRQALGGPLRPIPLGRSATGMAMLDLNHDGPHVLVAGTTGSGKSELLRSLVGGLAAAHSPADVQFVFIDFKGGAALGALGRLPHASSLVTDLGGHGMERTLASLRAELQARESALARFEAADARQYRALCRQSATGVPGLHAMAHLVLVIDEFRVLVDQFPDALAELMRLAAVGRSLGIHLVMATQRPQGAINADIRANVTSSICLRVQSGFDSSDVIGTEVAAAIDVANPGRAFISRAGAAPQEFQCATLALPPARAEQLPVVRGAAERLSAQTPGRPPKENPVPAPAGNVEGVADLLQQAWHMLQHGSEPPLPVAHAVVAPELPATLAAEDGACTPGPGTGVFLGLVDVPEQQRTTALRWQPRLHSHVACFGTTAQTSAVVALLAGQAAAANRAATSPEPGRKVHTLLYLLDGDGSLAGWADNPWVGSHVEPTQLRAVEHLLLRLTEVATTSSDTFLVCVTDWGRWLTAIRSSPWHGAEEMLTELIRFSRPNVTVVLGGARELLGSTFLPAIPNRVYLTQGSSSESTLLWPALPRFAPLPGRAAISGPFNPAAPQGNTLHVAQFAAAPAPEALVPTVDGPHAGRSGGRSDGIGARPPDTVLRVVPLPTSVTVAELAVAAAAHPEPVAQLQTPAQPGSLVLGIGGDGRQPIRISLAPRTVLPVLGVPGAGKSGFLRVLAAINGGLLVAGTQPLPPALPPGGTLWLDDAAALAATDLAALGTCLARGGRLVAAFTYPGPELSRLPFEWGLRNAQQGVVLSPQRPGDADLFGVRLQTMGREPPGRAVLLDRGRSSWFQFPRELQHGGL